MAISKENEAALKKMAEGLFKSLSISFTATNQNIFLNTKENKMHLYKIDATFKKSVDKLDSLNKTLSAELSRNKFAGIEAQLERSRNTTTDSFNRLETSVGNLLEAIKAMNGSGGGGGVGGLGGAAAAAGLAGGLRSRSPGGGPGPVPKAAPHLPTGGSPSGQGGMRGSFTEPKLGFGGERGSFSAPRLGQGGPRGVLENIRPSLERGVGGERGSFKFKAPPATSSGVLDRVEPRLTEAPKRTGNPSVDRLNSFRPGSNVNAGGFKQYKPAPMAPTSMRGQWAKGPPKPITAGRSAIAQSFTQFRPSSEPTASQSYKNPGRSFKSRAIGGGMRGLAYTNPVTGTMQAAADIGTMSKTAAGRSVATVLGSKIAGAVGILLTSATPAGESSATMMGIALRNYAANPNDPLSKASVKSNLDRAKRDYDAKTYAEFVNAIAGTEIAQDPELAPHIRKSIDDFNKENAPKKTTGGSGGRGGVTGSINGDVKYTPGLRIDPTPFLNQKDMGPHDSFSNDAATGDDFLTSRLRGGSPDEINNMNPAFRERLAKALADAEAATGSKAAINEGWRDSHTQAQYYSNYKQTPIAWEGKTYYPQKKGGLAAPPGRSRHALGNAADIPRGPTLTWLHKNAGKYGLEFLKGGAFNRDPVHIQLAGNAGGNWKPPKGGNTEPAAIPAGTQVASAAPDGPYIPRPARKPGSVAPTPEPAQTTSANYGANIQPASYTGGGNQLGQPLMGGQNFGNMGGFEQIFSQMFGGFGGMMGGNGGLFGSLFGMLGNMSSMFKGGRRKGKLHKLESREGKTALFNGIKGKKPSVVGHDPQTAAAFEPVIGHKNQDLAMNSPIHIGSPSKKRNPGFKPVDDSKNKLNTFANLENIFDAHSDQFVNKHVYSDRKRPGSIGVLA